MPKVEGRTPAEDAFAAEQNRGVTKLIRAKNLLDAWLFKAPKPGVMMCVLFAVWA